jgi:hypothetical protein
MRDLPRDQLDSYQPPEPSADLVDRIMKAVDEQDQGARGAGGRARGPILRRLAIAAAMAAVILGALLIWRGVDDTGRGEGWRSIRADSKQALTLGPRATAVVYSGASLRWRTSGVNHTAVEQDRGAVIYTVKKGGPFVVSVPGGSVQVVGTRFKVEVNPMRSRMKRGAVGAAALAVAVVAVYQGRVLLGNSEGEVALAAGDEGTISPGEPPRRSRRAARARASTNRRPARTRWARRFASARARQKLLRIIHAARTRRESANPPDRTAPASTSSGQASGQEEAPKGVLSKEYIRSTINEAIPLVKECYELSLHQKADLAGKLIAEFTISGEEEAGGLVEIVDITGEDSIARHPDLKECIQETIYSLEFPKPKGGGHVKVKYPFTFRPSGKKPPAPGQ